MSILDGSKQSMLLRESPLLPKSLLDIGWQQGALFSAPPAYFTWNDVSSSSQGDAIVQQRRKTKSGETFILITQDCDILEYHTYRGEETEGAEQYSRV